MKTKKDSNTSNRIYGRDILSITHRLLNSYISLKIVSNSEYKARHILFVYIAAGAKRTSIDQICKSYKRTLRI